MKKALVYLSVLLIACFSCLALAHDRSVYLTRTYHQGNDVLNACADGYHFASITEIFDIYNLTYNTELGVTGDDAGFGVPLGGEGWVRSGIIADPDKYCSLWTSNDPQEIGPITSLWDVSDDGRHNFEWFDFEAACDTEWRVYCVSDPEQGGPKFETPPGHQ